MLKTTIYALLMAGVMSLNAQAADVHYRWCSPVDEPIVVAPKTTINL